MLAGHVANGRGEEICFLNVECGGRVVNVSGSGKASWGVDGTELEMLGSVGE